jgi:hypothetical protein
MVCITIVRIIVCSPDASAIDVPMTMQEANAANLKIRLFIELKAAGGPVRFGVFIQSFRRRRQILALLAQR